MGSSLLDGENEEIEMIVYICHLDLLPGQPRLKALCIWSQLCGTNQSFLPKIPRPPWQVEGTDVSFACKPPLTSLLVVLTLFVCFIRRIIFIASIFPNLVCKSLKDCFFWPVLIRIQSKVFTS